MWRITEWHSEERSLDFTSSGLSKCKSRTVHLNGIPFCNAYSLFQWDLLEFRGQVELCECCGCVDCVPGGYVTMRSMNGFIAAIPVFDEILGGDDYASQQYLPPDSLRKHGSPCWSLDEYRRFRKDFPTFPPDNDIPPLSCTEAFHLIRMEAPGHILGDPYLPIPASIHFDAVLAASTGNHAAWIDRLKAWYSSLPNSSATVISPSSTDEKVVLYLDLPGIPEWKVAWHGDTDGWFLADDMKLIIQPTEKKPCPF